MKNILILLLFISSTLIGQTFEQTKKSAEQGDASAQNSIGVMLTNGTGVLKDDKKAKKWIAAAYESGSTAAKEDWELWKY